MDRKRFDELVSEYGTCFTDADEAKDGVSNYLVDVCDKDGNRENRDGSYGSFDTEREANAAAQEAANETGCDAVVAERIWPLVAEGYIEEGYNGDWVIDHYGMETGELCFYPPTVTS
jgi:hypothetical protein